MWDELTRARFSELRAKEQNRVLEDHERTELTLLLQDLDAQEGRYLTAANDRLRADRERLGATNEVLASLVARKEALVQRLESVLDEAKTERAAIDAEISQLMSSPVSAHAARRR